jgi:tetratricopeptide (TPR) repeat protein
LWNISEEFEPIEFSGTFIYRKYGRGEQRGDVGISAPNLPMPSYETIKTSGAVPIHIELNSSELPNQTAEPTPIAAAPEVAADQKSESIIDELMASGTSLADQGKFEEALIHVRKAMKEDNLCAPAYYLAGVLLEKTEQYDDAIEEFKHALYIDHGLTICYFYLGNLFKFLGRVGDAKREYKNCLKFLEGEDEDAGVAFAEGMTVGVLSQAAYRALESLNG